MLHHATRLLALLRGSSPVRASTPAAPPRRWADDLRAAGVDAAAWTVNRRSASRLYVAVAPEALAARRRDHPVCVQATLDAAERIVAHQFDLLGSGPFVPVDPDRAPHQDGYRPIDWYLDPVSGRRFPRGLPIAEFTIETMRPPGADIKLPWELGRCQHWPVLGQAFRLTGDIRFAEEIARELDDFLEANPIGTAVNWSCTMDVAIRAANWALALELIAAASLPDAFWPLAYAALFDHGVFIEGHLENTYEVTSNHFLSNVVGLFYVANAFRDLPSGAQWDAQCRTWLVQELEVQVLADGADYESSVPYHRLVTELFLGAARLAEFSGRPLQKAAMDRFRAMVDVLAALLRPDGLMPQIGDADDGRLHILSGYGTWNPQDPRHLLGPAACMFDRPDWMALAGAWGDWETLWWGLEPAAVVRAVGAAPAPMRHFPHAGLTVMRRNRDYLLVSNGRVGTAGFGNHKHNDLLGFEYHVDAMPVIVDAGSYVYTADPEARNLFRSTAYHNTVAVDGTEQNEFKPEWLFRMFEKAAPEHVAMHAGAETLEYRGRHDGYTRLSQPLVHERAFAWSRTTGMLTLVDTFDGTGSHRLRWHFHFAPGVEVRVGAPATLDVQVGATLLRLTHPADLAPAITPAWYSPSYGVRRPCAAVDFETALAGAERRAFAFAIETR
jgi:hypothetical protein